MLAGGLVVLLLTVVLAVVAFDRVQMQSAPIASGTAEPLKDRLPPDRRSPLPEQRLDGFGGSPPVDLATYRGKPLVVNFWATWCKPCVDEMPEFQEVAEQANGRVAFLGVNVADGMRQAEPFVKELGITYDLAADPDRRFLDAVEGFGMPTTLFVTPDGTIVYRQTGPLDADGLREGLRSHLGVTV